jgi:enoyl-CoA hydratase/carnithine racemase
MEKEKDVIQYEVAPNGIATIWLNRPHKRNCVSPQLLKELELAVDRAAEDKEALAVVFRGRANTFCSGADLDLLVSPVLHETTTSLQLAIDSARTYDKIFNMKKPTIAAVEGYAVAGGLELAAWCDLRVAAEDAVFGVFCRRWGIPLMDGGTIRLVRLLGHSHALDLILTGRGVSGEEALRMGIANRLVPPGRALPEAIALAREIASRPQAALRHDRLSSYEQWSMTLDAALLGEFHHGMAAVESGQLVGGLERYASGGWRRGEFT